MSRTKKKDVALRQEISRRSKRALAARKAGRKRGTRMSLSDEERNHILSWRESSNATQQQTDEYFMLSPGTTARLMRQSDIAPTIKAKRELLDENERLRIELARAYLEKEALETGISAEALLWERYGESSEVAEFLLSIYIRDCGEL